MAAARTRERWDHTAALLALIANAYRDPRRHRPFAPRDFHPDHADRAADVAAPRIADLTVLKSVFIDRRLPEGA